MSTLSPSYPRQRELSSAVAECIDERSAPFPFLSATRQWLALFEPAPRPSVEALSRASTTVARTMIDTANYGPGPWYGLTFDGISLINVATRQATRVPLQRGWEVWPLGFSRDGRYLAFVTIEPSRLALHWIDCRLPGTVHGVEARVNGTGILRQAPIASWAGDTHRLLVMLVDDEYEARVAASSLVAEAMIFDTTDPACEPSTGRFLADDQASAFRRYLRSQLAIVDVDTAIVTPVAAPALWDTASASPDGRYVLLREFTNPGEPTMDWREFTRRTLIKDLDTGATIRQLWPPATPDLEPHDRACRWHPLRPSTVAWLQATSTGDRLQELAAPFLGGPLTVLDVAAHGVSIDWTTTGRLMLTTMQPRGDMQFLTSDGRAVCPPDTSVELLPHWTAGFGERVILERDGEIFVTGHRQLSDHVLQAFCDGVGVADGRRRRMLEDGRLDRYECVLASLTDDVTLVLTSVESPDERPRLCLSDLRTSTRTFLGSALRPSPLARAVRRRLHYHGADGTEREIAVYLPPGRRPSERVPFLIWIDPSLPFLPGTPSNRYPSSTWFSPLPLVMEGYGVVEHAPLRIVGPRDTAVSDLVSEAEALVDALVRADLAERGRVAVGGNCAGGWIAALLLAYSDAFAAGVSCGGFFNLTAVAPDRNLTGRPTVWQDLDRYTERSPLMHVHRIDRPLLLIHGAREEMPIDQRTQSLQMFAALHRAGKTARYVRLPHEQHVYRARATVLRVLTEILRWCDEHV